MRFSCARFASANFIDKCVEILNKYDISDGFIEFEMTETIVLESIDVFAKVIKMIHDNGFRCSMDDFCSGYSSLNILKEMDVDVLKLDKAFFSAAQMDNSRGNTIIKTVITLAKELNMATVAEDIETKQQEDFLRETGYELVQVFFFSKPVPVAAFEQLVWPKAKLS